MTLPGDKNRTHINQKKKKKEWDEWIHCGCGIKSESVRANDLWVLQDFTMVVTRSMNALRNKLIESAREETTAQRAEVTNAKPGASQEVDAENSLKHKDAVRASRKSAKSSIVKIFDLDESTLAMGIFFDTLKEEYLKNDPDFIFTREFYHAAMSKFISFNDASKASYIAEAKKRNSVDQGGVIKLLRKSAKPWKLSKTCRGKSLSERDIYSEAGYIFVMALKAECLKNDPDFNYTLEDYDAGIKEFQSLNDDDKAPYIAESMKRYMDKCAKNMKSLTEHMHEYHGW